MTLSKLEQFKLKNYRKWYPKIQTTEQALQRAIEFETLYKTDRGNEECLTDSLRLFNMAELLEKAANQNV